MRTVRLIRLIRPIRHMKVLLINKFNYLKGGAERVFFDTADLLRSEGHDVAVFSMHHPKNIYSEYSNYFVSFMESEQVNIFQGLKLWLRAVYSFEAARKVKILLDDFKP